MNPWQVVRQLAYLTKARDWTGTSESVFGRVMLASRIDDDEDLAQGNMPLCVIRPLAGRSDPEFGEEPDLILQDLAVRLMASVEADPTGETALIGSNYGASLTSSAGAGILQVERELMAAVKRLQDVDGVRCYLKASSVAAVERFHGSVVAIREYRFEALCGAEPYYHPATRLAASDLTGGQASITWTLPPDRFDRYRVVLRRAAGATAPTTISGGSGVTLSGDLATSVTDSPGAGQFSYALFATYDETGPTPASDDQVSDADTVTVAVT